MALKDWKKMNYGNPDNTITWKNTKTKKEVSIHKRFGKDDWMAFSAHTFSKDFGSKAEATNFVTNYMRKN